MMPSLILPFADTWPTFDGEPIFAGPRSAVLGRATIGARAWLGEDSVVRADGDVVRIGDDVHLGYRATVHIVHELLPAIIGDGVTIGSNSIVHACTIGDRCVLDDDVTVLDEAVVGAGVLLEAGSTVFPRKHLDAGWIHAGSPARPVRRIEPEELAARTQAIRARGGSERPLASSQLEFGEEVFIAATSQQAGRLVCSPGSSLFFGVVADAGTGSIFIGANTNIQDNTIIRTGGGDTIVGRDTTVGHNVRMGAVRVGDEALVGMGAVLADGTWLQDDVLLAAGSTTEPGQVLDSGWMWGGRPAKAMSRLDAPRRAGMAENIKTYCAYSQVFRKVQQSRMDLSPAPPTSAQ